MICSCPKCNSPTDIDLAVIPPEGAFSTCANCGANFEVRKESFARRALYRGTDIVCAECGNPPGATIYCQSCHAVYPELLVITTSSAAKKQFSKILASLNVLKNLKIGGPAKAHRGGYETSGTVPKGAKGAGRFGNKAQLATVLVVLLILSAGGGYFWYQNKLATEYAQIYVKTLFVMKTARDVELDISNRLVTSWKAGAASTLAGEDLKSVASAKKDVDTVIKRRGKVPDKFTASNEALDRLYVTFGKLHGAITAPAGTSDAYAGTVSKTDNEFMKNARELKAGLPEKLADALSASAKKYKTLQDF
jgi:hypothetical protein